MSGSAGNDPGRGDADANRHKQQDENALINNRQNGRRRGRGGQPQRNGQPGAPDRGNRLDNRARGNAAQLLEKYKTLARDAQMQGDRVNTEYYLQFADHYFRVLSESRSRFEEQNQRRPQGDYGNGDYGDGGGDNRPQGVGPDAQGRAYDAADNDGDGWDDGEGAPSPPQQDQGRVARDDGRDRGEPRERGEQRPRRSNGNGGGQYADGNGYGERGGGYAPAPQAEAPERIEFDRVPPSLTADAAAPERGEEGEVVAPRRRPRRPRDAPAATDA